MSRKLTRVAVLGVLLCSVVFAGLRGVPAAHAAPAPDIIGDPCLTLTLSNFVLNTNQVAPTAVVKNTCGFSVRNLVVEFDGFEVCSGARATDVDTWTIQDETPGQTRQVTGLLTGQCETCVNHKAVAFPPFVIEVLASVTGNNLAGNIEVREITPVEVDSSLTNSPAFAFPCP